MRNSELIIKYFPDISDIQKEKFECLYELYKEWNFKINVISRKDIENIYLHHILHSLAIAKFANETGGLFTNSTRILDVGTGGGFPGIPLAIIYPDVKFTLCDSIGKKIKVASEIAASIHLENVTTICDRVENIKGSFDFTVSRAVTELKKFFPLVDGLYSKGMIFLKGGDIEKEINESQKFIKSDKLQVFTKPVSDYFSEEFFIEQNIIYLSRQILSK